MVNRKYVLLLILFCANSIYAVGQDVVRAGKEALNRFANYTRGQNLDYMFSNKMMNTDWLQRALRERMAGLALTAANKNEVQTDLLKTVEDLFNYFVVNPSLSPDDVNKLKRVFYNIARYQIINFMNTQPLAAAPISMPEPTSRQSTPQLLTAVSPSQITDIGQVYDQQTQKIQESGVKQLIEQVKRQNPKSTVHQTAAAVHKQIAGIISEAKNINFLDPVTSNEIWAVINKLNNPFYKAPRSASVKAQSVSPAFDIYNVEKQQLSENGLIRLIITVKRDNPTSNNEELAQIAYNKAAQRISAAKKISSLDKDTADELMFSIKYLIRKELPASTTSIETPIKPELSIKIYNVGARKIEENGIRQLINIVKNSNPQFNDEQLAQATYDKAAPMIAAARKESSLAKTLADELMFTIKFIIRAPNLRF